MIDSIHNVDTNFYEQFCGVGLTTPQITLTTHRGVEFICPIRFARKSAEYMVEDSKEQYPVISIQNYTPKVNANLFTDRPFKRYAPEKSEGGLVAGYLYKDFFPLQFIYDVSIACKSESEWDAVKWYFFRNHTTESSKVFKFNLQTIAGEEIYDPVGYSMETIDVFRTDGVFETNFKFTVNPWVQVVLPVPVDTAVITPVLIVKIFDELITGTVHTGIDNVGIKVPQIKK